MKEQNSAITKAVWAKRIRFKRNLFFLHILSSISHKMKQKFACHIAVWPLHCDSLSKQKTCYWNMKQKQKHLAWRQHKSECTGLAAVCGCFLFFLLTTFTESVQRVARGVHTQQLLHSKSSWLSQNSCAKNLELSICCLTRRRAHTSDCLTESNRGHGSRCIEIGLWLCPF